MSEKEIPKGMEGGVLLPGALDLSSFNLNLSAFQYKRQPNFFAECVRIVLSNVSKIKVFLKR